MQKFSIPSGTRDFTPDQMLRRNYIFSTIQQVFEKYGYEPIETPAMENLSTLLGKYGEEGDKLLFKILNSGDFLDGIDKKELTGSEAGILSLMFSEKGLRYDLTVPFARFVVQHRNEITFPFKRYQIQPVWRADHPQKGRYREFFQCDADVIGSKSLLNELELLQIIEEVFKLLNVPVTVKLNNRKILAGIAESIGQHNRLTDITTAIDKIDKIGFNRVIEELIERELPANAIAKLEPFLKMKGSSQELIKELKILLNGSSTGLKGVEEIETLFYMLGELKMGLLAEFDLTLARGLNYYTGTIIEVKASNLEIGSLCGGGRYDDLTCIFGMPDVSGVGISFGADRIYDVLNQLGGYPENIISVSQIMLVNFGEKEQLVCLQILKELRKAGIRAELYPDAVKIQKQLSYANRKKFPYIIMAGEEEIKSGKLTLKNMHSGEQESLMLAEIIKRLK